jgi:hypothetical protein
MRKTSKKNYKKKLDKIFSQLWYYNQYETLCHLQENGT